MLEVKVLHIGRRNPRLREHQLELIPGRQDEIGAFLGTDAEPVDPWWRGLSSIGFDGDFEAALMQLIDQRPVELQQRLPPGADDERISYRRSPPRRDRVREGGRRAEFSPTFAVGSDKVGIAELTDGARAILLTARPQIAA